MGSCTNYCSNCTDDTKEIKTAEIKGNTATTPFKKDIYDDNNPAMMNDPSNQFDRYNQNQAFQQQNNSFNRGMMHPNYGIDPTQFEGQVE